VDQQPDALRIQDLYLLGRVHNNADALSWHIEQDEKGFAALSESRTDNDAEEFWQPKKWGETLYEIVLAHFKKASKDPNLDAIVV
jgi:hypothetical protein